MYFSSPVRPHHLFSFHSVWPSTYYCAIGKFKKKHQFQWLQTLLCVMAQRPQPFFCNIFCHPLNVCSEYVRPGRVCLEYKVLLLNSRKQKIIRSFRRGINSMRKISTFRSVRMLWLWKVRAPMAGLINMDG